MIYDSTRKELQHGQRDKGYQHDIRLLISTIYQIHAYLTTFQFNVTPLEVCDDPVGLHTLKFTCARVTYGE